MALWLLLLLTAKPTAVVNTAGATASDADLADEYRIVTATVSQPFLAIEDKYSGMSTFHENPFTVDS